jgi:hypothetical protein
VRKLDVREIHGYNTAEGQKLVRVEALAATSAEPKQAA